MFETNNNTTLPIVQEQNVTTIAQLTPQAFSTNSLAVQKCNEIGNDLLARINRDGMSDTLDQECSAYVERARKALKNMNTRRTPVTKLFDQIRSEFTSLENAVDPSKSSSIPYAIQQHRNAYAARKREEAERQRRAEMLRQQHEAEIRSYKIDVETDLKRTFDNYISQCINQLTDLNNALTLENFDTASPGITHYPSQLLDTWFSAIRCFAHRPATVTDTEAKQILQTTLQTLAPKFRAQYEYEICIYRDTLTDALPSKRRELERMAQVSAQEQACLAAELKAKEAAELQRLDQERKRKEAEAAAAQAMQAQASEMDGLFAQQATAKAPAAPEAYQPKSSVKLRIKAESAEGILAILSLWWSKEGQFLPLEELTKQFKKQITFAEKLANAPTPETIFSPSVSYIEEVKAK